MKNIVILDLGGTISQYTQSSTAEFYNQKGSSIDILINEFSFSKEVSIRYEFFCNTISHEFDTNKLFTLGRKIQDIVDEPQVYGLVVSMGTNALEDIAYFIGLVVKTKKNVVFTGAHFPQNSLSFDGKKNLYNALIVAQSDSTGGLGIVVTFSDTVVTARWATKNKSGITNNFSAEDLGILGYVVGDIFHQKMYPAHRQTFASEFSINSMSFFPKVWVIYAHLNMEIDLIDFIISNRKIDGIISAGYGKGYQTKEITNLLNKAVLNGISVVRCARTGFSITNIDRSYDEKNGFIVASEFSPHKASILLSVCLAHQLSQCEIQRVFVEY